MTVEAVEPLNGNREQTSAEFIGSASERHVRRLGHMIASVGRLALGSWLFTSDVTTCRDNSRKSARKYCTVEYE